MSRNSIATYAKLRAAGLLVMRDEPTGEWVVTQHGREVARCSRRSNAMNRARALAGMLKPCPYCHRRIDYYGSGRRRYHVTNWRQPCQGSGEK